MEDENYFYFYNKVVFNGRIGIGTTTPGYLLQMGGGAYTDGNAMKELNPVSFKFHLITAKDNPHRILTRLLSL